MTKIIVLSYGLWLSTTLDSMTDCTKQAERIFQVNPTAEVWCCNDDKCIEQRKK